MRLLTVTALVLSLAGCEVANQAADQVARNQAKTVVNGIVSERFPGVNAAPVTDCVIDNASAREILTIASASATGVTQSTVKLVLEISTRPETVKCISGSGLGLMSL